MGIMHYVYLLKSRVDGRTYVGLTGDLKRRFEEHNAGQNFSTAYRRPFDLIYYEAYRSEQDAREREKALKHHAKAMAGLQARLEGSLDLFSDAGAGVEVERSGTETPHPRRS
jgi:putative endonuclease